MNRQQLLQEVLPYLVTYVQEGTLNITPYLYEELRIHRVEDLLKLAVLQQVHTQQFIEHFTRSRSVQQVATRRYEQRHDVRGHVVWQSTVIKQLTESPSYFVTEQTYKTAEQPMQQVVQYVAYTLYEWCQHDAFIEQFQTRSWAAPVTQLLPAFYSAMKHKKVSHVHVQPRTLTRMQQHRSALYRLAATLYTQMRAIDAQHYSRDVLQHALQSFLIIPQHEETLFELYWAVQLLKQQTNVTFFIQDRYTRPLASWQQGDTTVTLYHNKTGSSRVAFQTKLEELHDTHPFMEATKNTAMQFNIAAEALFERKPSSFIWRGRPDLLLEYVKGDVLTHVVIGEVKRTANEAYMQQGLKQLLHYMYFMKTAHSPDVRGFLAVEDYSSSHIGNIQLVSLQDKTAIHLPQLEE